MDKKSEGKRGHKHGGESADAFWWVKEGNVEP